MFGMLARWIIQATTAGGPTAENPFILGWALESVMMDLVGKLKEIGRALTASKAEREVERLLLKVIRRSPFAGKVHSVGGYNRDLMLGLEPKDLDIVVDIPGGAERLTRWLHGELAPAVSRPHKLKDDYPIWAIAFKDDVEVDGEVFETKGAVIEFADAMKETFPDPSSRQRKVEPATLKEDIERRDFTVNMMLRDMTTGEFKDMTGTSKADIQRGLLRGHPGVSLDTIFSQDPLRMIRLVRFQAKYGWKIPWAVLRTVRRNAHRIQIVSAERILGELTKIMEMGKLGRAIHLMKGMGLLKYVLPEVDALRGVKQDTRHHAEGDVFKHTMMVLQHAKPTIEGQMAALLHDIGKPATQKFIGEKIQFLGHEEVGAEMAEAVLRRLKFDRATTKRITSIIKHHLRPHFLYNATGKAIRKFVRDVGEELVEAILDNAEADGLGRIPSVNMVPGLRERLKEIQTGDRPVKKKPVLDGNAIMRILGIGRGPAVGAASKFLQELEDEWASEGRTLTPEDAEKALREEFRPV